MKHLREYITESNRKSKTITFDFTDLENSEDTIKSFEGNDNVIIDGNKVTVTVTPDNISSLSTVQDILQQFYSTCSSSSERTNNEMYAQLVRKFGNKINELNDAIDEFESKEDEDESDNDENDDEKKDDEKEDETE